MIHGDTMMEFLKSGYLQRVGVSSDPLINLSAMSKKKAGMTPKTAEMGLGTS